MIKAKVVQIIMDSEHRHANDENKEGLIINGETGEIEQTLDGAGILERGSHSDNLLKRADEVVDTVSIDHRGSGLSSRKLLKAA
jgi:hypothetical protein